MIVGNAPIRRRCSIGAAPKTSQTRSTGIQLETLLTEPLLAGVPLDHRLADRDRIALSELAGEPFVFFPRHRSVFAYDEFIAACRAAGFSPDIVQEASGIFALGLVAAGLGVTAVASSYEAVSMTGVRFVPITGHELTLQLAWSADNTNPALPAFRDTARSQCKATDSKSTDGSRASMS